MENDIFSIVDNPCEVWRSLEKRECYEQARDEIVDVVHKYNLSLAQAAYVFRHTIIDLGNTPIKDL